MSRGLRAPVLVTVLAKMPQIWTHSWEALSRSKIKDYFPFKFFLKLVSFSLASCNTLPWSSLKCSFGWIHTLSFYLIPTFSLLLASWSPQILFILANCDYGKFLLNNAPYEHKIIIFIYVTQTRLSHHIKPEKSSVWEKAAFQLNSKSMCCCCHFSNLLLPLPALPLPCVFLGFWSAQLQRNVPEDGISSVGNLFSPLVPFPGLQSNFCSGERNDFCSGFPSSDWKKGLMDGEADFHSSEVLYLGNRDENG